MHVVYFTGVGTGSGNTVIGLSIGLGLRRRDPSVSFEILSPSPTAGALCARVGIRHTEIPVESDEALGPDRFQESVLFRELTQRRPDVLIVNKHWFWVDAMLPALPCKKVFTSINLQHRIFSIPLRDRELRFSPSAWDECLALEPCTPPFRMRQIDPVVMRGRDEILSRPQALAELGVSGEKPVFLLALSATTEAFTEAQKTYAYLAKEGWDVVATRDFTWFPIQDCFAGVDLMASGAGYNSLWESVYHGVETMFIPQPTRFENTGDRMALSADYEFKENGADTLAQILLDL